MNLETYGLIAENPVRLNSEKAAMGYLKNLVTKNGNHILFHRLREMVFYTNNDGYMVWLQNPVAHYQICTSRQTIVDVYMDIHSNESLWIPPSVFDFDYEFVDLNEEEAKNEQEWRENIIKVNKAYVNPKKETPKFKESKHYEYDGMEGLLLHSWGVNYHTLNFPDNLWSEYVIQYNELVSQSW